MHDLNALTAIASVYGVYAGLLGIEHGYFETLQGNVVPDGLRILASASELPFPFGREPAMTIIPNYLATGILAIVVGVSVSIWAGVFVQRRYGALILLSLSVVLLLVGGGFGPMTLLVPAVVAAIGINRPLTWWRAHLSDKLRRSLAKWWPWPLVVTLVWVPAEVLLGFVFGVKNDPNLNLTLQYPLLVFYVATLVAGFAYQSQRRIDNDDVADISQRSLMSPEPSVNSQSVVLEFTHETHDAQATERVDSTRNVARRPSLRP